MQVMQDLGGSSRLPSGLCAPFVKLAKRLGLPQEAGCTACTLPAFFKSPLPDFF